ncbi:MAG: hypothetical protein ACXWE7_08795 [Nitrososphaeraceae archaeon]
MVHSRHKDRISQFWEDIKYRMKYLPIDSDSYKTKMKIVVVDKIN